MVQMKSNEKKNGKAVHLVFLVLQFNRSEHRPVKAEAAGSSPVSPDGSKYNKKKIHQFISSFSLKGRTNSRISFPLGMLSYFIYLFFPFTFLIKEIREFPFIQLVPIERRKAYVNQYNYWQKHIQDSKRYRTESVFFDYSRSV